jgi:ferric-dicitrate binding protein FerR (iron transport regulator)
MKMPMDCAQSGELITRTISGNASPADEAELKKHLAACPGCTQTEARLRRVWELMGQLRPVALTAEKSAAVSGQIARRPSRRVRWIAGLAAAVVLSITVYAMVRSPQPAPNIAHEPTPSLSPAPSDEPKDETVRDEAERTRVQGLLTNLEKNSAPVKPVATETEKQEPKKIETPAPSVTTQKPETPAPVLQQPEKKEVVREDQRPAPLPEKPAPPEREKTVAVAATLHRIQGTVFLVTAGTKSPAKAGQPIAAGAGIETVGQGSHAVLEFEDGTRIALGADTILGQVWDRHAPAEGKQIQLAQGVLAAQVVKQPAAEPMVFLTPHAEARVPAARLSLTIAPSSTRLDVRQNRARLTRKEDGAFADVTEGHFAIAGKGVAPVAKAAPGPKVFLLENFDHGKWGSALVRGGDAGRGLRFSTESGALSVVVSQKTPSDAGVVISSPGGASDPNAKLPPDPLKKTGDIVARGPAAKGELPRALWLEARPTFALSNDTPLRIRVRLWQSHSDADRSSWIALNRALPGQAILLERRGSVLQLWSEAAQAALWKKELPCVQEWESIELWLTKDQLVMRRNDQTLLTEANPLKLKTVQIAFGSNAKAELAQDEEARFDHFDLAWTTKADLEDVAR